MTIPVICPNCRAKSQAPLAATGRKARCPKCQTLVQVGAIEPLQQFGPDSVEAERKATQPLPVNRRKKRLLRLSVGVVVLLLVVLGSLFVWNVYENRRLAKAESTVRSALDRWCSGESLKELGDYNAEHAFSDSALFDKMRPQKYEITGARRGKKDTYEVSATLTFPGGQETRVYEVTALPKVGGPNPDQTFVREIASEDISGTEGHARLLLRAWLDTWIARENLMTFKKNHPEVSGIMTTDTAWASLTADGKLLVRYEITNSTPATKGFRFTVTAVIDNRGSPETRILYYLVYKDRFFSEGRWCVVEGV